MVFALPFALRLFPNLLPSTFEEKHQIEEKRKNLLKVRLEIAQVMMGTLEERALQLQRQRRAKEREKLAEAAASVPSGGGEAPPKKSAKGSGRVSDTGSLPHTRAAATSSLIRPALYPCTGGGRGGEETAARSAVEAARGRGGRQP